ncbi:hypothetical protein ACO2Q0_11190 [Phenylobacterium sp. VNQ135]|uniref:hypothetical protein n=1 Tax=Phenylobacterium sp. VNQ135 TaxID=3400922 RepID=UPI003C060296
MSRAVRNALMIGGLLALTWLLIVLAWRVAKWLFIVAVWVTGLTLLAQVVTQRLPPWIARLRGDQAQGPPRPPELIS